MADNEKEMCPECHGSGDRDVWDPSKDGGLGDWVPEDCRRCRGTGILTQVSRKRSKYKGLGNSVEVRITPRRDERGNRAKRS